MLSLKSLLLALTLTTFLACAAKGQSGTVTASGSVSETVMLSIAPSAPLSGQETTVSYSNLNAHTVIVSIKVYGNRGAQIAIPAQLRSNVGYTLSASAKWNGTTPQALRLSALRVTDARSTGRFVALDAVEAVNRASAFEVTDSAHVFRAPATLLTGPRISLAGTSDSPHNALEVTIMAEVEAPAQAAGGSIELILSAQPSTAASSVMTASR
ncbi:MAG: hypothetical protein WCF57_03270 [Pyrinomonadaceae bacterium]